MEWAELGEGVQGLVAAQSGTHGELPRNPICSVPRKTVVSPYHLGRLFADEAGSMRPTAAGHDSSLRQRKLKGN